MEIRWGAETDAMDIPGYKIIHTLGEGPSATVYLAVQESFERDVVLKVMRPRSGDSTFSTRFLQHARVISRLVHPHIATVYDVGVQGEQHYMSMEYLAGTVLNQSTSTSPTLTPPQSLQLIRGLALALEYAREKGCAHLSVKPNNILVRSDNGRAVLMDFGIASLAQHNAPAPADGLRYQAPEQVQGGCGDSRSDIYSLGLVLFELLTGHLPGSNDSADASVGARDLAAPRLPGNLLLLQPIINKTLAREAAQRYQTPGELVAAIDAVTDEDIEAIQLATKHYATRAAFRTDSVPRTSVAAAATRMAGRFKKRSRPPRIQRAPEMKASAGNGEPLPQSAMSNTGSGARIENSATDELSTLTDKGGDAGSGQRWAWTATAAALLLTVAGATYSWDRLPRSITDFGNEFAKKSDEIRNDLSAAVVFGSLATWNKVKPLGNLFTGKSDESSSSDPRVDRKGVTETKGPDQQGAEPASRGSSAEDDKPSNEAHGSEQTRQMLAQLKADISLAPQLAEEYRQTLAAVPGNEEARWELQAIRDFHYRSMAEALDARNLEQAKHYFASLQSSFPVGTGTIELADEAKYQGLRDRLEQLRVADGYLAQADRYLADDSLMESKAAGALQAFQRALEVDPGNPRAMDGLEEMTDRYQEMTEESLAQGNLDQALNLASRGLDIDGDHHALKVLHAEASERLARQRNSERLRLLAEQEMEAGNYILPRGESAYDYYQQSLEMDPDNPQALLGISRLERDVARAAETHINRNEFGEARSLLAAAQSTLGSSERLSALHSALERTERTAERNERADSSAGEPLIRQLLVSSQAPEKMTGVQKQSLDVERTIYIAFNYQNFSSRTSVIQAMLYDRSRGQKIAQVPVIVNDAGGVKYFQIDRPVDGFAEGSYEIALRLDDKPLSNLSFEVDR